MAFWDARITLSVSDRKAALQVQKIFYNYDLSPWSFRDLDAFSVKQMDGDGDPVA